MKYSIVINIVINMIRYKFSSTNFEYDIFLKFKMTSCESAKTIGQKYYNLQLWFDMELIAK